jgi:hypothetical protein
MLSEFLRREVCFKWAEGDEHGWPCRSGNPAFL